MALDNEHSDAVGGEYIGSELVSVAPYPFRRYFARFLDICFYNVLWLLILALSSYSTNPGEFSALGLWPVLMFFLEPLQLMLFGTTAGKAILGISLESVEGRKLTYFEGMKRLWLLFVYGLGLVVIPIFNIVCLYLSYRNCDKGRVMRWDKGVSIKTNKKDGQIIIGIFCFIGSIMVLTALMAVLR